MDREAQQIMEPTREDFCHPYQPYDIQLQFMQALYRCIEEGKVAILESPTGTGKSLSLICGALTWLRDHERWQLERFLDPVGDDETDWLAAAERANQRRQFLRDREELEAELMAVRLKDAARKRTQGDMHLSKKTVCRAKENKIDTKSHHPGTRNDDEFMLDDYKDGAEAGHADGQVSLSSSTQALLQQLKTTPRVEDIEDEAPRTKIIFCSRTHSQLTQFVHELRKVKPPPGLPSSSAQTSTEHAAEVVKHLPLGSRKNLCINPKVSRLGPVNAITERCLELQKPGTAKEHQCPYMPAKQPQDVLDTFRRRAIATIQDIEDVAHLGREIGVCPYYATRSAIPSSEVLTLPYPLLLQKTAREALGVNIEGNVVIIDEAHNLMDAIADTLSVSLSLSHLHIATKQVTSYVQRFKTRLKGLNRMYVTQVIRMLNSFTDCLTTAANGSKQVESAVTAAELMSGKGVDQIKPHKLLEYLVQSKLIHKVEGYVDSVEDGTMIPHQMGVLLNVQNFLGVLLNPDSEGRFFVTKMEADIVVKYTLLDPTEHFRDVAEGARAVILAGGTMAPMSDYAEYLLSYLDPDRLETFAFGHVIPKTNLMAAPVQTGPSGFDFDFTYGKRSSEKLMFELGQMVLRVCQTVPDGIVVFFPSYDYLAQVTSVWRRNSGHGSVLENLEAQKRLFEESRHESVDDLLQEYAQAIDAGSGGLMLSVVGGKLSEGINFSDKLGRAVIVVGLPFPNMNSGEWKAKIEHVESTRYARLRRTGKTDAESKTLAKAAGRDFYENACMRAVNQSIGRAIRHRDDYAAILLADKRYGTERIKRKLPKWILSSMDTQAQDRRWAMTENELVAFFQGRN